MKTNFFKKHLAFFLSTVFISSGVPTFAVKKAPKAPNGRKIKHGKENYDLNIFKIPEDQKNDFYIRQRKIHSKSSNQIIFGSVIPNVLKINWKKKTMKKLDKENLLPSETDNPCDTLYPFLVASLLRFAPYLLKPYNGGYKCADTTYYLSFAHTFRYNPQATLIFPRDLPILKASYQLIDSLDVLLDKIYVDEKGKTWTGLELATITVYLNAARANRYFQSKAIEKFKILLNSKQNILGMIDPLIDIVYKTSLSSYKINSNKKVSEAYKNFYLDIVKTIDPDRAEQFELLDENTFESESKPEPKTIKKLKKIDRHLNDDFAFHNQFTQQTQMQSQQPQTNSLPMEPQEQTQSFINNYADQEPEQDQFLFSDSLNFNSNFNEIDYNNYDDHYNYRDYNWLFPISNFFS